MVNNIELTELFYNFNSFDFYKIKDDLDKSIYSALEIELQIYLQNENQVKHELQMLYKKDELLDDQTIHNYIIWLINHTPTHYVDAIEYYSFVLENALSISPMPYTYIKQKINSEKFVRMYQNTILYTQGNPEFIVKDYLSIANARGKSQIVMLLRSGIFSFYKPDMMDKLKELNNQTSQPINVLISTHTKSFICLSTYLKEIEELELLSNLNITIKSFDDKISISSIKNYI